MCLYPSFIKNRKYTVTKKNGGIIPPVTDPRTLYVPIGCQKCMECRKTKAREWQTRLQSDIQTNRNGIFVTLTFSNESFQKLVHWKETKRYQPIHLLEGYDLDNAVATRAMRLFNERYRKKHKRAIRHWMTTEIGHQGTENIHLHGIIWTNCTRQEIENTWEYGYIWPRYDKDWRDNYVNEKTINYITKYVYKVDEIHKHYNGIVLTSPGIGKNYINHPDYKRNEFKGKETIQTFHTRSGHEMPIPIYWRNKLYTDKEREELWLHKLDENKRYVDGKEIDVSTNYDEYFRTLKIAREKNKRLGFGDNTKNWDRELYEKQVRSIQHAKRLIGEYANEMSRWAWMGAQGYKPPDWNELQEESPF